MEREHWQAWIIGLTGFWSMIVPWALMFRDPAVLMPGAVLWNFMVSGALATAISIATLSAYARWESVFALVLAAWLGVSPWLLHFADIAAARANAVSAAIVIFIFAIWELLVE